MKQLLFLLAVASSTLALWIALGSDREDAPRPVRDEPSEELRPAVSPPLEAPPGARVDAAGVASSESVAPGSEPGIPSAAPSAASARNEPVRLRGTVVVTDADGREDPHASGSLTLFEFTNPEYGSGHEVTVERGAFEVEFAPGSEIKVGRALLEGRPARVEGKPAAGRQPLPADLFLELRARWGEALVLEVKDAQSGRHLDRVTLVCPLGFFPSNQRHPGTFDDGNVLLEHGVSPIDLQRIEFPFPGPQDLFVHSPGYAWNAVRVDTIAGGEQLVVLEPGAGLALTLNEPAPAGASLVLQADPGETPVFQAGLGGKERLAAEGLPAGEFVARVLLGDWYRQPLSLAEAPVQLTAGATLPLQLVLTTLETPDRVGVRGELIVPAEWRLDDPALVIELRGVALDGESGRHEPTLRELEPGRYAFALEDAQPGFYQADVQARGATRRSSSNPTLQYAFGFEVGAAGLSDLVLAVPPPATVVATVVDGSGAPVPLNQIMWSPCLGTGVRGGALSNVPRDADTGTYRFRAPTGAIRFSVHGSHALTEAARADRDVRPGENRFELEVHPLYELALVLRDADTVLPWNRAWKASLEALGGEGRTSGWGTRSGNHYLVVDQPGRYRLTLSELPGYAPVPAVELELGPGGVHEHVIELVRLR